MTKNQFLESVRFTGAVQSSISEMRSYMREFDTKGLSFIVEKLEGALNRFRKSVE